MFRGCHQGICLIFAILLSSGFYIFLFSCISSQHHLVFSIILYLFKPCLIYRMSNLSSLLSFPLVIHVYLSFILDHLQDYMISNSYPFEWTFFRFSFFFFFNLNCRRNCMTPYVSKSINFFTIDISFFPLCCRQT